jgi:hypothetical protein
VLFGTPPRAVRLATPQADRALEAALAEALEQTLPWLAQYLSARPET